MISLRKVLSGIVALISLAAIAAPQPGFEFRGLRTGMLEVQGVAALNRLAPKGSWESRVECPYFRDRKVCTFSAGEDSTAIFINAAGLVASIEYRFEGNADESTDSFVRAFSEKYGKPAVEQRGYINGMGNQFTGPVYSWARGKQMLFVEEMCAGKIGTHCVTIADATYATSAKPKI